MQADYAVFIDRVIKRYEGGYGWNRKDPGGPTNFGITCFDLATHRGQKMDSMERWAAPVKAMTLNEAEGIYATKYATKDRFNDLSPGKDTVFLDYGINSGTVRPIRVARALLKLPDPAGGTFDDALLAAVNKADPKWFINAMCDERLHFMHAIRGGSAWAEFGKGWGARVADLRQYSMALVNKTPAAQAPDLSQVPTPKATHVDPNASTKPTIAGTAVSGGGGIAAYLADLNWWYIGGAVGLVVAADLGYTLYKANRAKAADNTVVLPAGVVPQPA